ncbi:MAG TPA: 4-hydroxyphenylacetate 3-hydroxylase C-terminal domain-containing protein [Streptosporangiaceae bacterium]|nr:4-hydroxyphenylacetate 3-hydroxylase C-terminal domain-containing protein [Streptosporangiaceae bacterium]
MVVRADELVGLAQLIAEANGLARISHVREKIDEMIIHATLLRAGLEAALNNARATPEGYYYPDDMYTNVTKYQAATRFNTMVRHLHDIAGGAVATAPSAADFDNPTLGPFLRKYMAAGTDVPGDYRASLFRAIRDLTADAYGGWHLVTNIQSGGGLFAQRLVTRRLYDMDRARALTSSLDGDDLVPFADLLAQGEDVEPDVEVADDDPLALAFTSGTTGLPKGVLQPQRMLKSLAMNMSIDYEIMADEFRYTASPTFHIAGQATIFMHVMRSFPTLILTTGARPRAPGTCSGRSASRPSASSCGCVTRTARTSSAARSARS